jgi:lysyl-tRNA synthetase class 2
MPASTPPWQPTASLEVLRLRAGILASIREFFRARSVLEVETPQLSMAAATDPQIQSIPVDVRGQRYYLHSSPEFPMKRLLAAGSGPVYQICRVFRQDEAGRQHNPEFTMLEWYRPGMDHHELMQEVAALVLTVLPRRYALQAPEFMSYAEVFARHGGIADVHTADLGRYQQAAESAGLQVVGMEQAGIDSWRDLLMGLVIAPRLGQGRPCFIHDYPASQAALARVDAGSPATARRFELFIDGMEIANGFHELADPVEQRRRFEADNHKRQQAGLPIMPLDERLVEALAAGLPDCAGVAVGLDRLVMLVAGVEDIAGVLSFSFERA